MSDSADYGGGRAMLFRTAKTKLVRDGLRALQSCASTIRDSQFVDKCTKDTVYSESEGRSVFIALGYAPSGDPVSVAVCKAQGRKRGAWGRYATLTYAYTEFASRRRGWAKCLSEFALRQTDADRVKSLAASRLGLELHRSLGHKFWGLSDKGQVVVDSPLSAADMAGVPAQVRTAGGQGEVDYKTALSLFKEAHVCDYAYRCDPEEFLLNGCTGKHGYKLVSGKTLLSLAANTVEGEMLRWENRKGAYVRKPDEACLKDLVCFYDSVLPHPWYYAGERFGQLRYRVTVSKIGEHRPSAGEGS